MTEIAANLLIKRIEREQRWPPPFDRDAISRVARFAAYREADAPTLRQEAKWREDRPYVVDPIGDRIALAKADLMFGEDAKFRAAREQDIANLERVVNVSDLSSELHWAEQLRASEGETWYRLMADQETVGAPMITIHSREVVVPLYVGSALIAVAFVSEFEDPEDTIRDSRVVWRHLEIQSEGRIENRLYKGTKDWLGEGHNLEDFSETAELEVVWDHGIPEVLAGRVVYRRGRERHLGRSVFQGVEDLMLALNEAMTIGVENARLVGKKRVVMPADSVQRDPNLPDSVDAGDGSRTPVRASVDVGEDVILAGSGLDATLGREDASANLFKVLEYSFDAEQLVVWQDKLVKVLASRCGLTVSFIGEGSAQGEGTAETGTALRVRLLPATSGSRGAARGWQDLLPRLLMQAQLLDAAPVQAGGFGRSYSAAGEPPSVELSDPLPRDETEDVNRHSIAVGGPIESVQTAVRDLHPDWTDEQIDEEVRAIRSDVQTSNRLLGLGAPPGADEDPEPGDVPPVPGE